ncbi:MAG: 4Fe-4S binding protein [Promethearchaeota archaeon]
MMNQGISLPFNPPAMVAMFASWIIVMVLAYLSMKKGTLSKKKVIILLVVTLIIDGVILGAIPNPMFPFNTIFMALYSGSASPALLLIGILLGALLVSTLLVGRLFCGYACPVGAMEELISKIGFKSSIKAGKKIKFTVNVPRKLHLVIRFSFLIVGTIVTILWGISIFQIINPFGGFQVFKNPVPPAIAIPLITLIVIAVASIFIYRPWCRFACPFGAIASLTSKFSKKKLVRTSSCTDCGICEKVCPTYEAGKDASKSECYLCLRCVEACPQDALKFE